MEHTAIELVEIEYHLEYIKIEDTFMTVLCCIYSNNYYDMEAYCCDYYYKRSEINPDADGGRRFENDAYVGM